MPRVAYVNGQYVPLTHAATHIEDRGFQFADSVYDALMVRDGVFFDEHPHLKRLERSLNEIRMELPMSLAALQHVIKQVIARNRIRDGFVYIQVSRGVAPRDHGFPEEGVPPTLVVTAKPSPASKGDALASKGVEVITVNDPRWHRCDIKSVGLLPNILAKQEARENDAFEAWFVAPDGEVREGTSTNAWIVDKNGVLRTRPVDQRILSGVTRGALIDLIKTSEIPFEERGFTLDEIKTAQEAFISSATNFVLPVVGIDGARVADGKPGPVSLRLRQLYLQNALQAPQG